MTTQRAQMSRRTLLGAFAAMGSMGLASALFACGGTSTQFGGSTSTNGSYMLSFALPAEPTSLDPAVATDDASLQVMGQVYEGLLRYAKDSCTPEPCLAELPTISDDGLTYTFALREGVAFHDNSTFDAGVAKKNIDRLLEPQRTKDMSLADKAFGSQKAKRGIESVEATNSSTLVIKLRAVDGSFAHTLAMLCVAPMVAPNTFATAGKQPVGTGPYKFSQWEKGDAIILERNERYWDDAAKTANGGIMFRFIEDGARRQASLEEGSVDICGGLSRDEAHAIESGPCKLVGVAGTSTLCLFFNVTGNILKDADARIAFAEALDAPTMVEAVFGRCAEYASTIVPVSMARYDTHIQYATYDPDAAAKQLANKKLSEATCIVCADSLGEEGAKITELANAMVSYADASGVRVTVESLSKNEYASRLKDGTYDLRIDSLSSLNGDAQEILESFAGFDKNLKKLVGSLPSIAKEQDRFDVFKQCEQIIAKQLYALPLCHPAKLLAHGGRIQGLTVHPTGVAALREVQRSS